MNKAVKGMFIITYTVTHIIMDKEFNFKAFFLWVSWEFPFSFGVTIGFVGLYACL